MQKFSSNVIAEIVNCYRTNADVVQTFALKIGGKIKTKTTEFLMGYSDNLQKRFDRVLKATWYPIEMYNNCYWISFATYHWHTNRQALEKMYSFWKWSEMIVRLRWWKLSQRKYENEDDVWCDQWLCLSRFCFQGNRISGCNVRKLSSNLIANIVIATTKVYFSMIGRKI